MSSLIAGFPDEILIQIFGQLDNRDLLVVQSVCRRFCGPASSCFRTVTSNVLHWRHASADISRNPLAQYVRNARIIQEEVLQLPGPDPLKWAVDQYEHALEDACQFPGLRGISLSLKCLDRVSYENDELNLQGAASFKVLCKLFDVGQNKAFKKLELAMLPPLSLPITRDYVFALCMSTVETLILHFDSWYCDESRELNDNHAQLGTILSTRAFVFAMNIAEWIGQSQDVLKVLSLSFENYAGYCPRLDFRNLYYPYLRVLELTSVTFFHITQISWIVRHADTLRTVHLEDCPVIAHVETQQALNHEGFPIPDQDAAGTVLRTNKLYWHHIFELFRAHLNHLRDFSITLTCMDPELKGRKSGLMPQRYKSCIYGEIVSTKESREISKKTHNADVKAYVRLVQHTGQPDKAVKDILHMIVTKDPTLAEDDMAVVSPKRRPSF